MNKKIIIIGSGFSALSASCYLAQAGYEVVLLEKNSEIGGRARQLKRDGFVFDIGPTFYWMPDVFEKFFNDFGKKVSDYYQLDKLNPAYEVYFGESDSISIADNIDDIKSTFESVEKGAGVKLEKFIDRAGKNYDIAIKDLVYKPGKSIFEIITVKTAFKLNEFVGNIKGLVARYIKNEKLRQILEFPVLFLGAKPSKTPAFYNFMNYADLKLGTWHPKGGMYSVVEAMVQLAGELGVKIIPNSPVTEILIENKKVYGVKSNDKIYDCDILLSGADYHHTETLLPLAYRQYSEKYWSSRTFAPSALLFYIGFDKEIEKVSHHTLFFDTDFAKHAKAIYDTGEWPESPLFYSSFPGKTDDSIVPSGKEAGIVLIPLAPNLEDNEETREKYFNIIIDRMEKVTQQSIRQHILFKESYCVNNFKEDYNSYKGNAYGLANTLFQTHILRPRLQSKKLKNLFFTGQLTVPGPGVPPSLISGEIVSKLIMGNK
jgi:phytoene desaturase